MRCPPASHANVLVVGLPELVVREEEEVMRMRGDPPAQRPEAADREQPGECPGERLALDR